MNLITIIQTALFVNGMNNGVYGVAKSKWQDEFKCFAFVISQIRTQSKKIFDFDKVSSADRNMIYHRIWKQTH